MRCDVNCKYYQMCWYIRECMGDIGDDCDDYKPERPHGEWIAQRLQNGFDDVYCPFCKARPTRSEYGYYLRDNFCHECGADMRLRILDEADDGAGKDGNVKEGEEEGHDG